MSNVSPENIREETGILPCSALGCGVRTGVACEHIDRRGRLCSTAWCPDHRHALGEHAYCAVHSAQLVGLVTPMADRGAAVVNWLALAAEDDIVSILNDIASRVGAVTEAESLRATADSLGNRVWQLSWRVRGASGVVGRVAISTNETAPEVVHLSVDDVVARVISIPALQLERAPQRVDLDWLLREVLAPISFAVGLRGNDGETELSGHTRTSAAGVPRAGA